MMMRFREVKEVMIHINSKTIDSMIQFLANKMLMQQAHRTEMMCYTVVAVLEVEVEIKIHYYQMNKMVNHQIFPSNEDSQVIITQLHK